MPPHFNPLRSISQRLSATPVEELPQYAAVLATSITSCSDQLKRSQTGKDDTASQLQKLSTRITSLLQGPTQEGRLTGIVLVKSLVEAAGLDVVIKSLPVWIRALISCINKQDPPQVRKLAIVTVTRIFSLTKANQEITREVTTPSLRDFLTACLGAIKPVTSTRHGVEYQVQSPLLQPVWQCWIQLMTAFPSTVRPFVPSMRTIVLGHITQQTTPQDVKDLAVQVFVHLHFCAPKGTAASEWLQSLRAVIEAANQTADRIYRSVVEEWSAAPQRSSATKPERRAGHEIRGPDPDAVGMDRWLGLHAGCARMKDLIHILGDMLTCQHAQLVHIPLADVLDLLTRVAAVVPPTEKYQMKENPEIGRDEREELVANLPLIHCRVLELCVKLADQFGLMLLPISQHLLSLVWDIFETEQSNDRVRAAAYDALRALLHRRAVSLHVADSHHLTNLIRACCSDLKEIISTHFDSHTRAQDLKDVSFQSNPHQGSKDDVNARDVASPVQEVAWSLLPIILACVPHPILSRSARTEIDRTAVLLGHEDVLVASVVNQTTPQKGTRTAPSLLPFLTRASDGKSLAIETLLRPRQPIIQHFDNSPAAADIEGEDQSASFEDDLSADKNLQTIANHVSQQLDDDPAALQESPNHVATAKRNHDVLDADQLQTDEEASKRFKTRSPSPMLDRTANPTTSINTSVPSGYSTNAEAVNYGKVDESVAELSLHALNENNAGSTSAAIVDHPANFSARADDSDASEIPQIDATLTSDDDEDTDEDVEMGQ